MKNIIKTFCIGLLLCCLIPIINSCKRSCPPEVTTATVNNITPTSAVSGGEVTDIGCSDVIARGVCWSTSQDPDITDNKTTNGLGPGTFTSTLENLIPDTQYFLRAYATNESGTGYDVVLWIEREIIENGFIPPQIKVHSANISARTKMELGIQKINQLTKHKS